jgi:hypothetical protein
LLFDIHCHLSVATLWKRPLSLLLWSEDLVVMEFECGEPYVRRLKLRMHFAKHEGSSRIIYCTPDMIGVPTEPRIHVMTFTSHKIQICQLFDVSLGAVPKRHPRYELLFNTTKWPWTSEWKYTTADSNTWRTSQTLVLEFDSKS